MHIPGLLLDLHRQGLHTHECIRNRGIYLFLNKLASVISYFVLSHVIVRALPPQLEAAKRKMNVGG